MKLILLLTKVVTLICQIIPKLGGTALPGLIALKLSPTLINQIVTKNQLKSIIITGTNGKTTTSRLISSILDQASQTYLQNRHGSNLLRGIASVLVQNANLKGLIKTKLAIWEIDEAKVLSAIKTIKPKMIIFNNLFRDQLDRYGEIDKILSIWQKTIKLLPKSCQIIINVDDPHLNYLVTQFPDKNFITYGLNQSFKSKLVKSADAITCPNCHHFLTFSNIITSHLGHYTCPNCHFQRQNPQHAQVTPISQLPGRFNLYNLLAAKIVTQNLKISKKTIRQAFKKFKPVFGRAEKFTHRHTEYQIFLVKNPTGFNSVLTMLTNHHLLNRPILIILNDLIADGTDVSWIYDVHFKALKDRETPIFVSGLRAHDLSLRLKLAGINQKLIQTIPNLNQAINKFLSQKSKQKIILPTYTAMLATRHILQKKQIIHSSWID